MRTIAIALACLLAGTARAQEGRPPVGPPTVAVPLRVQATGPGATVEVDRGTRDGLRVGDAVTLLPRDGAPRRGTVARVRVRSSDVDLLDCAPPPPAGTRGEAHVPAGRFAPAPSELVPVEPDEADEPAAVEHPPWPAREDDWVPGMPLLAGVEAGRPQDRPARITGRVVLVGDATTLADEGRDDAFLRTGLSAAVENPWGRGGVLELDLEANHRRSTVPDLEDVSATDLRLNRFSYHWGGTRFAADRLELGRFWQRGVPELGLLDGVEWSHRLPGGDRFGASLGFAPEPLADLETGQDLQVAAWYTWVSDPSERLTATAAYQKTWHGGAPDRDLLVAKARSRPGDGWDLAGTVWVDVYTSGDVLQGSGVELTQANLRAGRRDEAGNGYDLSFRRTSFPDVQADLFLAPDPVGLADLRNDRVALDGWHGWGEDRELYGGVGAWVDEDDSGGDAEVGVELYDLLLDGSTTDVALFGAGGKFTTSGGARVSYGREVEGGRWDVTYQYVLHDQEGFVDDVFLLPGHSLRASRGFRLTDDWYLSLDAGVDDWDHDTAWSVGFYLQRLF